MSTNKSLLFQDNVVTAARLASVYRMGDLDKLALKYQETQFRDLVSSQVL